VSNWTDLIGWPWPSEAGINAATGAELIQAYARGVGRIVAAEAEIARRTVSPEPSDSYEERLQAWLQTAGSFGSEVFDNLHRAQLAAAVTPSAAGAVAVERGTVAFVDLCGSTQFMLEQPPQELHALVDELFFVAEAVAAAHDVTVVKYLGDGVVLLAAAPHAAVDAASQLIAELRGRVPLPAGAGVAHGRLLSHAGDCIGPAMNMASRLAELAAGDEVLVDLEDWPAEPPGGSRRMISPRGLRLERAVCALHVG
jgi:Adenylate and Guanylate cyclase catalytic domain